MDAPLNVNRQGRKMPKKKSFNTIVLEKTIEDLQLSRLEASVFYRLLGFLLRDDNPFIYTAEKLAAKTLYKRASIFDALNSLEKKGLIDRRGYSYQRRFSKGKVLVEICTHVQKSDEIELHTSPEAGLPSPKPGLYRPKPGYNKTDLNSSKHVGDLVQKIKKKPQTQILPWPELTEEQVKILGDYKHGLKYPEMQLTGFELQKGKALYRREFPNDKAHG